MGRSRDPEAVRIRTALVVYKKSAWDQHVAGRGGKRVGHGATRRALLSAHLENSLAIEEVKRVLEENGVRFRISSRADLHPKRGDGAEPDLFVSIGGDGTFLETSHQVRRGLLLGVNSSPAHSVGFFCAATRKDFASILPRALAGDLPVTPLSRLEVRLDGKRLPHDALNDVLVTHQNPGATSRYLLQVAGVREHHRSSGVWIATPAGSTAGIRAAGGELLPIRSDRMQFAVREIYVPPGEKPFRLKRGTVPASAEIRLVCEMIDGALFIDGPRHKYPLHIGDEIRVRIAREPLRVLGFRGR